MNRLINGKIRSLAAYKLREVEESAVVVPGVLWATGRQRTGDWLPLAPSYQRDFIKTFTTRKEYNKLSAVERGALAENFRRAQAVAAPSDDSETTQLLRDGS